MNWFNDSWDAPMNDPPGGASPQDHDHKRLILRSSREHALVF